MATIALAIAAIAGFFAEGKLADADEATQALRRRINHTALAKGMLDAAEELGRSFVSSDTPGSVTGHTASE